MMRLQQRKYARDLRPKRSRVAILHTDQYSDKLGEIVYDGLGLFNLNVRGESLGDVVKGDGGHRFLLDRVSLWLQRIIAPPGANG